MFVSSTFKEKLAQSAVLLLILLLVWFVRNAIYTPGGPIRVIQILMNDHHVEPPSSIYRAGPYPPAFDWNPKRTSKEIIRSWMNSLILYSNGHLYVTAAEYGGNLRLAFFPKEQYMVLNPHIVRSSSTLIECEQRIFRHEWVDVEHYNAEFHLQTTRFQGTRLSCAIQAFIERDETQIQEWLFTIDFRDFFSLLHLFR